MPIIDNSKIYNQDINISGDGDNAVVHAGYKGTQEVKINKNKKSLIKRLITKFLNYLLNLLN